MKRIIVVVGVVIILFVSFIVSTFTVKCTQILEDVKEGITLFVGDKYKWNCDWSSYNIAYGGMPSDDKYLINSNSDKFYFPMDGERNFLISAALFTVTEINNKYITVSHQQYDSDCSIVERWSFWSMTTCLIILFLIAMFGKKRSSEPKIITRDKPESKRPKGNKWRHLC